MTQHQAGSETISWMLNAFMNKCKRNAGGDRRGEWIGDMNVAVHSYADDPVLLTEHPNVL